MNLMLLQVVLLIIGLFILIRSSELTIKYAIEVTSLLGISEMVVGFVLVAVSTSLPELAITVVSSVEGGKSAWYRHAYRFEHI